MGWVGLLVSSPSVCLQTYEGPSRSTASQNFFIGHGAGIIMPSSDDMICFFFFGKARKPSLVHESFMNTTLRRFRKKILAFGKMPRQSFKYEYGQLLVFSSLKWNSLTGLYLYRPVVNDCEAHIYIKQGRHPVIDHLLPENEQFVPNDTHMNVSQYR